MRVVMQRQVQQQKRWYDVMSSPSSMQDYMLAISTGAAHEAALAVQGACRRIGNRFGNNRIRKGQRW